MPGIVPRTLQERIDFFADRLATWDANAAAIGVSKGRVQALGVLVAAARNAAADAAAARIAAENATVRLRDAIDAMSRAGAGIIASVRAQAKNTGDDTVFALASLPPVAARTNYGVPPAPTGLSSTLTTGGQISLAWDGSRAGQTAYTIERAIMDANSVIGPWSLIGISQTRQFLDTAVPRGAQSVLYRVRAQRAAGLGEPSQPTTVFFGTPPTAHAGGAHAGMQPHAAPVAA